MMVTWLPVVRAARDERFEPLFDRAAWQQDATTAAKAAQTNIGAQSNNDPVGGTAWVGFTQSYDVVKIEIRVASRLQ